MAVKPDLLSHSIMGTQNFPGEETLLRYKFKRINVRKNSLLLREGEICRYAYFICKGCLRTYFVDEHKEEKTRSVAFENRFISASASFITQTPSAECIQALEHSELLRISWADLNELLDTNPFFNKLYRHSLEQLLVFSSWRIETMITMTAKQRYEDLLDRLPQVFQRLSNKHVASFLGITQESLSRLKGVSAKNVRPVV